MNPLLEVFICFLFALPIQQSPDAEASYSQSYSIFLKGILAGRRPEFGLAGWVTLWYAACQIVLERRWYRRVRAHRPHKLRKRRIGSVRTFRFPGLV